MGCKESSKVTKTARLRAPTQERATCSQGRARAGSVPTASPGPRLAPAGSIHKLTIRRWAPFPGRASRPLPARSLPRSQRQRSLMIKHRCWAPPASFASTALWLCLIITTEGSPCTRHPVSTWREFSSPALTATLLVCTIIIPISQMRKFRNRSHRLEVTLQGSGLEQR